MRIIESFLVGLTFGYFLSVTLVFKYRRLEDRRREFASFAGIGIIGLALSAAVILFGVSILGLHNFIAKFSASGVTFLWNFIARREFLFVPRPTT